MKNQEKKRIRIEIEDVLYFGGLAAIGVGMGFGLGWFWGLAITGGLMLITSLGMLMIPRKKQDPPEGR